MVEQLDLDRHCGVIIAPSGAPCMRSLTCKSHSMISKMAIKGRSKDFQSLLSDYIAQHPQKSSALDSYLDAESKRTAEPENKANPNAPKNPGCNLIKMEFSELLLPYIEDYRHLCTSTIYEKCTK